MTSHRAGLVRFRKGYIFDPMKRFLSLVVFASLACVAACGPKHVDPIKTEDAFLRATPMKMSAGYVLITNNTDQDDAITGVTGDWAGRFELHQITKNDDGVMGMAPVESIALPKGETIALRPDSLHIMVFDLNKELNVGETREATLHFTHAKPVTVTFKVKPITYKGVGSDPAEHEGHH